MASETQSGGTFVDDASVGTIVWSNPGNAAASDDSRADAALTVANNTSHYLKATNFGFSIPSGMTIIGIEVKIEKSASEAGEIEDNLIKLVKGGIIQGDSQSDGVWPTSDAIFTYGDVDNLWGSTWSVADINASNFGVAISAFTTLDAIAYIDHIEIIVYYTDMGPINEEGASTIIN